MTRGAVMIGMLRIARAASASEARENDLSNLPFSHISLTLRLFIAWPFGRERQPSTTKGLPPESWRFTIVLQQGSFSFVRIIFMTCIMHHG